MNRLFWFALGAGVGMLLLDFLSVAGTITGGGF